MRILVKLSILFLSFCIITGCEKDDEESGPAVKTLTAEAPVNGGIILYGELKGASSIDTHGFYYSEDSLFSRYQTEIISLDKPDKSGKFHAEISTGLKPATVYFFKAFIQTGGNTIFGKTSLFLSTGSLPPEIIQVIPEIAHIEDTVKIYGKYFGGNSYAYYTKVIFSGGYARIIQINDSLITCVIPETNKPYQPQIKVSVFDKSDSVLFQLHKPVIESFSPSYGNFRDTISIIGQHFDRVNARNKVLMGSNVAEIISSSRNIIKVVIPDDLDKSISRFNLSAQLQNTISETSFRLIAPEISKIPECCYSYSEIEIKGKHFHPIPYKNKVFIEDIETQVLSGNTESLTIEVPMGPFPRGHASVKVQVADTMVLSESEFCIKDNWLMISNSLPFSFYGDVGTFTIGNTAYVISGSNDYADEKQYLWEFDSEDYSWEKHDIPFDLKYSGVCTSIGEKGYIYSANETNDFWEFDPSTHTWAQKTDFPGERRDKAAIFAVNQNVYVGIGSDFNLSANNKVFHDFYKYDPFLNVWSRISDLNSDEYNARTEASTFVIGSIAYLTGGARTTGMYDAWKYTSSTDQWIRIADFPDARNYASSFTLNGKGYIVNGTSVGGWETNQCWEYDPTPNEWKQSYDIGHRRRYRGFAFSVNGIAFVGGGSGGANDGTTNWELFRLNK